MARDERLSRRRVLQGAGASLVAAALSRHAHAQAPAAQPVGPYAPGTLPPGIRSRFVENINGIRMHVLEAGHGSPRRPAVLLVHGFPELGYSWRKVMRPIADAGFHVIAPDLRGYGRTSGTDVGFDDDLAPYRTLNQVRDLVGLVWAFGHRTTAAIVGHDFGSPLAAWCSIVRPDVFRATVLMSAPFAGTPALPFDTADRPAAPPPPPDPIYDELARLNPPRKHYQRYFSTREANQDMWRAPQGVHAFLRAYYHMKSADWAANTPFPLAARTAAEWAKLPRYYVMDLDKTMAETVAPEMPTPEEIAACRWLPDDELRVYSEEFGRTGFQGGLQSYRVGSSGRFAAETQTFAGRTIDQPSLFISGKSDWGVYQNPGAVERMQQTACTRMMGVHLVEGAGHWVQQERPDEVARLVLDFIRRAGTGAAL
ncbi:MAG: alpha/beta hydrolase, partial [Acidobacteriota bacterium]